MTPMNMKMQANWLPTRGEEGRSPLTALACALLIAIAFCFSGCSTEKIKMRAMETAAKYWQDKAYPGKGYDVQVLSAEKADDGLFRVKGNVDHEAREGTYNPQTDTFSEGYYPLQREKGRRVAELELEVKYWKNKADDLEKENYKLKVRLGIDPDSKAGVPTSAPPAAAPPAAGPPAAAPAAQ